MNPFEYLTSRIWDIGELLQMAEAAPTDIEPLPSLSPTVRPDRKPFRLRVVRGGKIG